MCNNKQPHDSVRLFSQRRLLLAAHSPFSVFAVNLGAEDRAGSKAPRKTKALCKQTVTWRGRREREMRHVRAGGRGEKCVTSAEPTMIAARRCSGGRLIINYLLAYMNIQLITLRRRAQKKRKTFTR